MRDVWEEFVRRREIAETRCMSDLPAGWEALLDRLCDRLEAVGWDRRFAQVKEKFGCLRIYFEEPNDRFEAMADECECASSDVCAACGSQGRIENLSGWYLTVCDGCAAEIRASRR